MDAIVLIITVIWRYGTPLLSPTAPDLVPLYVPFFISSVLTLPLLLPLLLCPQNSRYYSFLQMRINMNSRPTKFGTKIKYLVELNKIAQAVKMKIDGKNLTAVNEVKYTMYGRHYEK